jgi:hypothetical protein
MRRASSFSREGKSAYCVERVLQTSLDRVSPRRDTTDVLDDNAGWLQVVDDSVHFPPQSTVGPGKPVAASVDSGGCAGLFAGEATTQHVNPPIFGGVRRKGSDVIPAADLWPMLSEHTLAELVDFALPPTLQSGTFESKIKPSNSREQTTEC